MGIPEGGRGSQRGTGGDVQRAEVQDDGGRGGGGGGIRDEMDHEFTGVTIGKTERSLAE